MPGTNLTREQARRRAELLRVDSYDIELDLTATGATYRSTSVLRFAAREEGAATFVDLVAAAVHEITLNGRTIDPATGYRDGRIELDGLAADNELRVVADCAYSHTGQGLHRTVDPVDDNTYLYTHFEVPDARRVFATFEQPDLKAPFTFTVIAPDRWTVRSNSPTPDPEPVSPGVAVWRFVPTPPIPTYLTAVVAGDYHLVTAGYTAASGQVIPLALACRRSMADRLEADEIFELTRQGFDYYLRTFDRPYPFAKYDQVFVPEYNIGAMENAGLVTVVETLLFRSRVTDARRQARATTLLHEMAHMWFGDLVTPRWWDDLWLKESFATYMATRAVAAATRWTGAWTAFANHNKAWALEQDQLPSTHPIVADIADLHDVQVNFDGITYAKGAAVLKQLVAWVGDGPFLAGAREFFDRYGWGNATLADLLAALSGASGRDLTGWSDAWLRSAGPDTLRPEVRLDPDGRYASFAVLRQAPALRPAARPHRVGVGLYRRGPTGLERTGHVEVDLVADRTGIDEFTGVPAADVALVNDEDLTYARIRFDPRSLSTVLDAVGEFTEALPRALCWTAGWDMVRAAELPARDWLRMVLGGIGREDDIGVVERLHRTLLTTLHQYLDPADAAAAGARVAAAAVEGLHAAAPGSDVQLAWALLFARVAGGTADLDAVAGLLDGRGVPAGLVVDTDLRWALLAALVRHGRADRAEIEAELARDPTTTGRQNAAGALAARPDRAAKRAAWTSIVDRDDLPNGTVEAVIGGGFSRAGVGFVQPGQDDLLAPYVEEYFAALPRIWAGRPMEIARRLVTGLYPRLLVSPETVARTDAFLARQRPEPALRRLLVEARDDVERALRVRAGDLPVGPR